MSRETITKLITDNFKTQPVLKAWIFGSFSPNELRLWNDVDIMSL
jgi:hypothetical protein